MIDGIFQGIGASIQGAGTITASAMENRNDAICGLKPAFWAKKSKRDAYDKCISESAKVKLDLAKSASAGTGDASTENTSSANKGLIIGGIILGVAVIILVIVVISRRK